MRALTSEEWIEDNLDAMWAVYLDLVGAAEPPLMDRLTFEMFCEFITRFAV